MPIPPFGSPPGASKSSAFVTIGNDSALTGERALTGTANQIIVTDNGANSTVVLSLPQSIATSSTPTFAGLNLTGQLDILTSAANMLTIGRSGGYTSITPTMTSNTAPSPYATIFSSEVNSGNMSFQAFNKNNGDRWIASTSSGYVGLDFGSALWAVARYSVYVGTEYTRAPNTWTFEGSQNNSTWTVLDTQTGISNWSVTNPQIFSFTNTTKYRYYRINVTVNNGDPLLGIFELDLQVGELFNMTVLSTEIDTYGPLYMKNAAGTAMFSLDTVTPLLSLGSSLTLTDTSSTIITSKSQLGLILKNDAASATFGVVTLTIENIGGANGAEFRQWNNSGAEVVDFLFTCYNPGTTTPVTRNLRFENRVGSTFTGVAPEFQFGPAGAPLLCISTSILARADFKMLDATNIVFDTTTGTKIGTSISQKLSFFNATPVTRPATTGTAAGFSGGIGTTVNHTSTFTGNTGSTAYTIGDIVNALKTLGLMAA